MLTILSDEPEQVPTAQLSFTLTERAAAQVKRLLEAESKQKPVTALRVGVRGGGCSGLEYFTEFTNDPEEGDQVFEQHGVRFFIDPKSAQFLTGTELDYSTSLKSAGFRWNNPNQKRSCGCGESFAV